MRRKQKGGKERKIWVTDNIKDLTPQGERLVKDIKGRPLVEEELKEKPESGDCLLRENANI